MFKIVTRLLPCLLVLSGCASFSGTKVAPTLPMDAIQQMGEERPAGRLFLIHPDTSDLRIVLGAEGSLARLGHPHVVGGAVIQGELLLADDWRQSTFQLWIPVEDLMVDVPDWREDEGFPPNMPAGAIEATRRNMLSASQLDAVQHPLVIIEGLSITGPQWQPDISVRMTVAGYSSEWTIPVTLYWDTHRIGIVGQQRMRLSQLGIEPFAALAGRLRVADEFLLRFSLQAVAQGSDQSMAE